MAISSCGRGGKPTPECRLPPLAARAPLQDASIMNAKALAMRTQMLIGALAVLAALAGTGTAEAGPPGSWTQVTGTPGADLNTLRVGLARTADGVLHVGWTQAAAGTS